MKFHLQKLKQINKYNNHNIQNNLNLIINNIFIFLQNKQNFILKNKILEKDFLLINQEFNNY